MKTPTKLAAAALALLLAVPALGLVLAGKEVPDSVEVGGTRLVLNGAGIRTRFFFKVYVGALYLPARSQDPAAIVAADEPKCVRIVFLRDVSRDDLRKAYHSGIEKNSTPEQFAALEPKLDELSRLLPEKIREGSELQVAYLPGQGTLLTHSEGARGTVEGKDFSDAMFRTWLGDRPAEESLKQAMLGR
jgi:hypothetical protein